MRISPRRSIGIFRVFHFSLCRFTEIFVVRNSRFNLICIIGSHVKCVINKELKSFSSFVSNQSREEVIKVQLFRKTLRKSSLMHAKPQNDSSSISFNQETCVQKFFIILPLTFLTLPHGTRRLIIILPHNNVWSESYANVCVFLTEPYLFNINRTESGFCIEVMFVRTLDIRDSEKIYKRRVRAKTKPASLDVTISFRAANLLFYIFFSSQ